MIVAVKSLILTWATLFTLGTMQGPSGSITGTLRSPEGAPQAGVRVAAMVVPGVPESGASALVSITLTDERGRYVLEDVPPGRYYIVSGNVAEPTYYPGTFTPAASSIVTVSAGSALSGYDFTMRPAPASPAAAAQAGFVPTRFGLLKILSGRIVTEDGRPLPSVATIGVRLNSPFFSSVSTIRQRDFGFVVTDGEYRVSIEGLPAGYTLKSISFGNANLGLGAVKIDAASQGEMVLTLSVSAVRGVKVSGKLTNLAAEWNVERRPIRLVSSATGGPTIVTFLNPDNSFEFATVPAGAYQISFGVLGLRSVVLPTVNVGDANVSDLTIDFANNPFPEYPGSAFGPTFDDGNPLTLRGTVTQGITRIQGRAPAQYFRIDARDETTGAVTPWAILVTSPMSSEDLMDVLKLTVGAPVTVSGTGPRDGTHRLSLVGSTPGTVNDQKVPRQ